ncbi:type I secretion system ATPase [Burkholderia aenigmatica]|uniref:type I secretion system permease/ATPase n=1 Tax=Burkholderia cepacia complex TaxID=87882 RepID=UPI000F08DDE1|nr:MULTISPECIES: type I secretion system permease/ATPase [Burkholderia cepacia complex]AYQ41613.1 type I secretion system permease/ATPase [Burkholderia lata]UKD13411.1 type I secretion system permease/ATPase [Burkholderia aenigmatica]VWC87270.1 type I secretion system ATPase [Burkholderia aenigmatica]
MDSSVLQHPVSSSTQDVDSGLAVVLTMASLHGIAADEAALRHEFGFGRFDTQTILRGARSLGMTARVVQQNPGRLDRAPLPAVAQAKGDGNYFVVGQYQAGDGTRAPRVLVQFPGEAPSVLTQERLLEIWTGKLIYFTSKSSIAGTLARFDFSWFIPAIVTYRKLLGEVLALSLVLQLIALATPLFFQVVMDKVLVNHAMKTLNVIAVGLICATLFDAALSGIRAWVFAHTSSKIDVELGARLFRHLLALPLAWFQARRVGDSVARIRELENIRAFLTGNAVTLVMDLAFSFVFLGVMLWYSAWLTLIVVVSIPLYVLLSIVFTPVIRRRLNEKFNKGAENQSFLVETISGIDTVKAMALEPRWTDRWDRQLAAYVSAGLSATNVATIASGGVMLISKLVTAAIMWLGATLVMDGRLTVGELVAFNMLAGQVSSPILRLAQLWNDFQQVGISMGRLGDILNTAPETAARKTRVPRLAGAIEFDQVSFRYRPDASDVIRQISVRIAAGEVIGIVGRSGSGKSTLTKLAQRLYVPDRGRVLVDGHDIAVVDTASLRQQIGVVLQENTLFNRSVRDNIALARPTASIDAVIDAAKLAGAHEFICELPEGYDTLVGEHGTGLSGGQRQRIAIARALMTDPRVLIFDEATSALDYESEAVIQANMRDICARRTVLIIAHRLSAVRDADRILVMDRGQIVESGTHDILLRKQDGIYAHLYSLQQGGRDVAEART